MRSGDRQSPFTTGARTPCRIHFCKLGNEIAISGYRVAFPRRRRHQITGQDAYAVMQNMPDDIVAVQLVILLDESVLTPREETV